MAQNPPAHPAPVPDVITPAAPDTPDAAQQALTDAIGTLAFAANVSSFTMAALAIIITLVFAIAGIAGYTAIKDYLEVRRRLRASVEKHESDRKEFTETLRNEISAVRTEMEEYRRQLDKKVEVGLAHQRESIAGELRYRDADFESAADHFRRALALKPDDELAAYYLARSLTYIGSADEAIGLLTTLCEQAPKNPRPARGLALALRFRDNERAEQQLHEALRLAHGDNALCAKIQNERGLLCRDEKKYDKAVELHKLAAQYKTNDALTDYFLGVSQLLCGQNEGRTSIKKAALNAPEERQAQSLKPVWLAVIVWSARFIEDDADGFDHWQDVQRFLIVARYLENTIMSHVNCLAEATKKKPPGLDERANPRRSSN